MASKKVRKWYALRVSYRREMRVKYELDALHIKCFIPMKTEIKMRKTRKVKTLVPAIHNLVFVYANLEDVTDYKDRTSIPLSIIKDSATDNPVVIAEHDMQNFIGLTSSGDEHLIYIKPNPREWNRGERVRIIGGVFKGYEGRFVRIKGDRRVVVEIPGVMAVATGFIHPSFLEPIAERQYE